MNYKQLGFSLLELIIVIVIIGLLAAASLPKMFGVIDDAKEVSVQSIASGFSSGVMAARTQWEAQSRPSVSMGSEKYNAVDYDGIEFWLTRSKTSSGLDTGFRDGYPMGLKSDGSGYSETVTVQSCIDLMENLLQQSPVVGTTSEAISDPQVQYSAQADDVNSTCTYVQQELGSAHQFVYELKTGRVAVTLN